MPTPSFVHLALKAEAIRVGDAIEYSALGMDLCSQVTEVREKTKENSFEVTLKSGKELRYQKGDIVTVLRASDGQSSPTPEAMASGIRGFEMPFAPPSEARQAPYTVTQTTGSNCPNCGMLVSLLSPEDWSVEGPSFYLCVCGFIGQVGVKRLR